ncbi:MAG: S-methyl-5-thioribose-1-phosphate isomerase [Cyanobacteria bacterium]|nr:S-methyl-5-thioribose-1-phosphate isomerase [Cyanobacteria bacterium CG_2015-16_32_12]NCO77169.1 S-methyl-5-thioribose-1-phosphate isomerase [Cyanobacteria bacterium CG_2015-22_32_23]NCQ04374.1 S-methyl-5-thioribose-1-phosphate isomerase [Cyanobacteria bacterium CG_2015-09_32_10]NCQ41012.1 S-methyl-5-thioribose-1-phosphate isomerase [Cyanobacteria bacterium CG_2015-04_32_10]
MNVNGKPYRTIWLHPNDNSIIQVIDQRYLPHQFIIEDLATFEQVCTAIKEMHVRGAGVIGAAAAYGMYLASLEAKKNQVKDIQTFLHLAGKKLKATRPTAVNLAWAVNRQLEKIVTLNDNINLIIENSAKIAQTIAEEDVSFCQNIGKHGVKLLEDISHKKHGEVVNILTHCNAGWLGCVDNGTATSPIYEAYRRGIKVHVWVDETRPRNQGSTLTAWELGQEGVPHTIIPDNAGGHLMQHGLVDVVITGSDRTTYTGDVANKIGTYLKAVAAKDNNIPFYVALTYSAFDWEISDGVKQIPIEERDGREVKYMKGLHEGEIKEVLVTPENSPVANYGFDVTPARLITGLITERGICQPSAEGIFSLYPEKRC